MAWQRRAVPALLLVLCVGAQGPATLLPHVLARTSSATGAGRCSAEFYVSSIVRPRDTCIEVEVFPGSAVDLVYRCRGGSLQTEFFNASSGANCTGVPYYRDELPLETCSSWIERRGGSVMVTCNGTSVTIRTFSLAPPVPQGIQCASPGTVTARANAATVDQVSFEVALPHGRPFLSYSASVDEHGVARASIPGLQAFRRYRVFARAHRRGLQEGNPDTWSNVSAESVLCTGAGLDEPPAPRGAAGPAPSTRWIEVFRVATGAAYPDFLDQHNVGDLVGEFAMAGAFAALARHSPMTRYCVELLDVSLPNVSTASLSGGPEQAPFADYQSCVRGRCECMHQVDRSIARLPARQIRELCSGPVVSGAAVVNDTCRCSNVSTALSRFYVGRSLVALPFESRGSMARTPVRVPDDYPAAAVGSPVGHFYSFPYAGRCAPGAAVGAAGCTWRRSPLAHTVYTDELLEMGLNTSMELLPPGSPAPDVQRIDLAASLQNIELGRRAFAALGAGPCGGQAGRGRAIVV